MPSYRTPSLHALLSTLCAFPRAWPYIETGGLDPCLAGWETKTIEFKDAFDGGKTLRKIDSYPPEDPAKWVQKDTETFSGMVREDEEGCWHW